MKFIIKMMLTVFVLTSFLNAESYFVTNSGSVLPRYTPLISYLGVIFGEGYIPENIKVEYKNTRISEYTSAGVLISTKEDKDYIVLHEATHYCLFKLSSGANTNRKYKFLDEGLATISDNLPRKGLGYLKVKSDYTTVLYLIDHKITVDSLKRWKSFSKYGRTSYLISASFVLYLYSLSDNSFKPFLFMFGELKGNSFDKVFYKHFNISPESAVEDWVNSLPSPSISFK